MSPAGVVYCARARRVAWSSRHSLTDQVPAPPAPRSLQLVQRASGVHYAVPGAKIKFSPGSFFSFSGVLKLCLLQPLETADHSRKTLSQPIPPPASSDPKVLF